MAKYKYRYLFFIQYLGFRFHGWQKQGDLKTVHFMIDKTLPFALGHSSFKTMGSSRTDAMVSAELSAFELFLHEPIAHDFLAVFNSNLPPDIKALRMVDLEEYPDFNILQSAINKEYRYYFSSGQKAHPYASPFIYTELQQLDTNLMAEGAKLFEGTHFFGRYGTKTGTNTTLERTITTSEICECLDFKAGFFPKKVFDYRVASSGFMRNQVRLIMGQLLMLGLHQLTLEEIEESLLQSEQYESLNYIAPSSGLHLISVQFERFGQP